MKLVRDNDGKVLLQLDTAELHDAAQLMEHGLDCGWVPEYRNGLVRLMKLMRYAHQEALRADSRVDIANENLVRYAQQLKHEYPG